jgi:hypothetical protein
MSETVSGSCLCGAVVFEATLPSRFCAHCHCDNCRRAHGAAFVTWVGFAKEQFRWTAAEDIVRSTTDTAATRSFCGKCGSTLTYEGPRWADEVHVVRANIAGEIAPRPRPSRLRGPQSELVDHRRRPSPARRHYRQRTQGLENAECSPQEQVRAGNTPRFR